MFETLNIAFFNFFMKWLIRNIQGMKITKSHRLKINFKDPTHSIGFIKTEYSFRKKVSHIEYEKQPYYTLEKVITQYSIL